VTELRWTGTGAIDLQDSTYRFYYAGPANKKDVSGTGFLVNKRLQPNVSDFKKINDRISELTIQVGRQKISLVAIYAPASTTKEDDDPYETFLEKLDELKRRPNTIILGDFNAKVGRAREGEDSMGHFGHGERNYRGERLVEFCELRGLRIINTFFKQRRGRMWTWRSPNGVTRNVIDFILAAKESAIIKNVGVVAAFNFNTDHRLIRARLDLTIHQAPKKMQKQQEVGSKRGLDKNIFRYAINHFLPQCAENAYEPLKDVIQGAATIATITTKKKSRISEETKVLLQRRHYLRQLNTPQARIDMVELNKTTRRSFREDIEQHRRRAVERAVQEGRSLKKIAQTTAIGKQRITQLRGDDGRLRTDKAGISETTKHFYEDLYATHVDVSFKPTEDREECPPFLESEVRKALSEMKSGKAPGNDGITVEMLKAAQEELIPRLTEMFNDFLRTGTIDDNLADSSTLLLFKKGDPAMLKNYRPISLLATIYKLLTKTITRRIEKTINEEQDVTQAGFRAGFSTLDHILTLCELIERSREHQVPLFICFVDFEKAFDSVEMNALWNALQEQGIPGRLIRLLRNIYSKAKSEVRINSDDRVDINIARGVRQGDTISPLLFNAALERIFRRLDWQDRGISINGRRLSHLRFADDIALISETSEELQLLLQELDTESTQDGLKINDAKTEMMSSEEDATPIQLRGRDIKVVDQFVYLGRLLSIPMNLKAEINRRIRAGWLVFSKFKKFLTAPRVPMKWKRKLFNLCILPAMLYGCEAWTPTQVDLQQLAVAQRKMERRMAGTTLLHKKTNEWLRGVTRVVDIVEEARRRKWRYAWNIAQKEDKRWTRALIDWQPIGRTRGRGRPRTRWQDDFRSGCNMKNWIPYCLNSSLSDWLLRGGCLP